MPPPDVLICRFQPRPPTLNERMIKAAPLLILAGLLYGLIHHGWNWIVILVGLPSAVAVWFAANIFARERRTQQDASIEIDSQRALFTFRNFRFVSTFLPEKPRPEEVVRFDEVLGAVDTEIRTGLQGMQVRTAKGTVLISSEMENFPFLERTLEDLLEANLSRADDGEVLATEPKIKTPWYGWLILLAVIAAVAYLVRKFMYSEY